VVVSKNTGRGSRQADLWKTRTASSGVFAEAKLRGGDFDYRKPWFVRLWEYFRYV
jgi:hypothetical protein